MMSPGEAWFVPGADLPVHPPRSEVEMASNDDPIEFELFKNALFAIADEMALTVFRTTCSGVLEDNMDYSTAFCDRDGKLVAQGLRLPGHLGSIPIRLFVTMTKQGDQHGGRLNRDRP